MNPITASKPVPDCCTTELHSLLTCFECVAVIPNIIDWTYEVEIGLLFSEN